MIQYLSIGFENEKLDFRFYEPSGSDMVEFRVATPDEELIKSVNDLFALVESKSSKIKEEIHLKQITSEIERRRQELAELERQASEGL